MLKALFAITFFCFSGFYQVLGQSCSPHAPVGTPSVLPITDSIPCAQIGVPYSESIFIENLWHQTVNVQGTTVNITVDTLRIDTIKNIPCGLKYAMNPPNGVLLGGQTACLNLYGRTNDSVGQYRLAIYITIVVEAGSFGTLTFSGKADSLAAQLTHFLGNGLSFKYWIRVIDSAGVCPLIDKTDATDRIAQTECYFPGEFISSIAGPQSGCAGETVPLVANIRGLPSGALTYLWSDGETTDTANILVPGIATVTVTAGSFSDSTVNYEITSLPLATDSFGVVLNGTTVMLNSFCTNADLFKYVFHRIDSLGVTADTSKNSVSGNVTYTFMDYGTYEISLFDTGACGNGVYKDTVDIGSVGIAAVSAYNEHINISPNPAKGIVNLLVYSTSNSPENYHLVIFNMQGREIYQETVVGNVNKSLDISKLGAGIYMVRVQSKGTSCYKKLVIE